MLDDNEASEGEEGRQRERARQGREGAMEGGKAGGREEEGL
jgi:hypothetical protein